MGDSFWVFNRRLSVRVGRGFLRLAATRARCEVPIKESMSFIIADWALVEFVLNSDTCLFPSCRHHHVSESFT
jgi:hypothetical protein